MGNQVQAKTDGTVTVAQVAAGFQDPPAFYRPAMFWAWNADPTPETIGEQLRDMHRAGVGGVVIMPMPATFRQHDFFDGIHIPYLSDEFFRLVRVAAEECRTLGLKMWIYDEGGWPSGIAGGLVTEGHPEFRGQVLKREGDRFVVAYEGYPTDLMNPAAVRRFMEVTHERYRQSVGDFFGDTIVGVFTDEMRLGGRVGSEAIPWTERLPDEFEARKGYALETILPLLFAGAPQGAETERARCDFCDVYSHLFAGAYFEQIGKWCEENGLLFTGHVGGEDEFLGQHWAGFGHFFRVMGPLSVPAVDAIWRQIFPAGAPADFPKLASSAAHHLGKRYSLTESFAVYGWGLTLEQMKWVTDHQFVRGINLMQPMMVCLKEDEYGLANTASHLGPGNPLWEHFDLYAKYVGRLSWMLSQGEPSVEVAVYLPVASRWAGVDGVSESLTGVVDSLLRSQIDFDFIDDDFLARATTAGGLLSAGPASYRVVALPAAPVVPAATLQKLARFVREGGHLLVVDDLPRQPAERGSQTPFASARERLFWSEVPQVRRSKEVGKGRVEFLPRAERDQVGAAVAEAVMPYFRLRDPNPHIRYCRRQLADASLYFLTNESDREQRAWLDLGAPGAIQWDLESGTRTWLRRRSRRVRLTLPPYGSALISDGVAPGRSQRVRPRWRLAQKIKGPWLLRPLKRYLIEEARIVVNAEAGEWTQARLGDWREFLGPHFSGTAEYRCEFNVPEEIAGTEAAIDLGRVRYVARVRLNGQEIGRRAWVPYRLEVSGLLQPNTNVLEVEVTNTLADQALRPDVLEMMQARGWRNVYRLRAENFEKDSLGGGLLGPLTLLTHP